MADNAMEQIVSALRQMAPRWYPQRDEMRNVRIVGHTPKHDHYIYDTVIEFADGGERLAIKAFRAHKGGAQAVKAWRRAGNEKSAQCLCAGRDEKAGRHTSPAGRLCRAGSCGQRKTLRHSVAVDHYESGACCPAMPIAALCNAPPEAQASGCAGSTGRRPICLSHSTRPGF